MMGLLSAEAREMALSLLILFGLLLPLLPVPGDGVAHAQVHFRIAGMSQPHAFTAATRRSTCEILARVLAFEDPQTGEYTRISCAE